MDDEGFDVIESDMPGGKVDFHSCVVLQMIMCNRLLARINDTPPGLHTISADLADDDLKPNKINYISAVDAIEITLSHIIGHDKLVKKELEDFEVKQFSNNVEKAKEKHRIMIRLMARNNLLPLQSL